MNLLSGSNMKGVSIYGQLILSLLFITCFIDRWEIMRYGWLSLDISPCEVVCNGYFGDIGKLQCPL